MHPFAHLCPPGPRVAAVKLIHTVNDSSNRLRVAAQVNIKTLLQSIINFVVCIEYKTSSLDCRSTKSPRLERSEPPNSQSLLYCGRGWFFQLFNLLNSIVSFLTPFCNHFLTPSQSLLYFEPQEIWIFLFITINNTLCHQSEVASRVLAVCKAFDKISADQLNIDSHFIKVTYSWGRNLLMFWFG